MGFSVGVIGGGIAGLSCARRLQELGIETVCFDTGVRAPGGRASSRVWRGRPVDHAAQFASCSIDGGPFTSYLRELEAEGKARMLREDELGVIVRQGECEPLVDDVRRYVGVGGIGTIAGSLADGLDIRQDVWVSPNGGLARGSDGIWRVRESAKVERRFDHVVIAHNGKCAERLTSRIPARRVHALLRAKFGPSAAGGGGGVMTQNSIYSLLFECPRGALPDGLAAASYVSCEPALSFLSNNDNKLRPADGAGATAGGTEVWTALSSGAFGRRHKVPQEHLEGTEAEAEVTSLLLSAVERAAGLVEGSLAAEVSATRLQLWGAAVPVNFWDGGAYVYDAEHAIGIAGDWLLSASDSAAASTLEAAYTSGRGLAEHIASPERRAIDHALALGESGGRFVPSGAGGFGADGVGGAGSAQLGRWVRDPLAEGAPRASPRRPRSGAGGRGKGRGQGRRRGREPGRGGAGGGARPNPARATP